MKRISRYVSLFVSLIAVVCVCGCNEGTSAVFFASSALDEATSSQINATSSFAPKPKESLTSQTGKISPTSSALDEATSSQVSATASVTRKPTADRTLWKRKMVAITFDDGPHETNPQLLDMLKKKDVKVTFFMLGQNMEKRPEIVKRAIEEGHDVGWHSYQHTISLSSSEKNVSKDFDKAQSIMDQIVPGYKITLYRGPGGGVSDVVKAEAAKRDWRIINWSNYGFNDQLSQVSTPQERMAGVFDEGIVSNGSVLLIHPRDNQDILDGIGLLIDRLKTDGYECVTVSELLKRRNGGTAGMVYGSTLIY